MTDVDTLFEQYLSGSLSLAEFESRITSLAAAPGAQESVVAALDSSFAAGRLPTQVYHMLLAKVRSVEAQDEDTVVPELGEDTVVPTEAEDTVIPPTVDEDPTESTLFVGREQPAEPTEVPAEPEPASDFPQTEIIVRPAADEDTRAAESDETRVVTSGVDALPTSGVVHEFPAPADSGTSSNWARPDQWTDKHSGPIGPGTVIKDRFHIVSQIGQGGMGTVFKARDRRKEEARDADPFIAIKILNEDFKDHPQSLVALQREASKAQTLAHPNIVTVYDFDRDGSTVYMTMELMRGQSLSEYIRSFRQGGASPGEAGRIIAEMAAGLAYAHKKQIVHSDFKPGNVFLTEDNRVKILDFGIARATQLAGAEQTSVDEFDAGDLGAMTPGFASLEMLNGEPPDPSDDVYALAATAYQLLTGNHPFDRKTAKEALVNKLSPRPIKGLKRREWKTIARGLELRREERIPDATQFLRRFQGPTKLSKISAVAIIVLSLSAAFFAWESVQEPGPDVPFEELSTQEQKRFSDHIGEGDDNFAIADNAEAIRQYASAYDLHPRNPIAEERLDDAINAYIDVQGERAMSDQAKRRVIDAIEDYQARNEHMEFHDRLNEFRQRLERELASEAAN